MKITEEIAYLYLKEKKIMGRYSDDFKIVDIYYKSYYEINRTIVVSKKSTLNLTVIQCEYIENDNKFYRNVHIDPYYFQDWFSNHRENQIEEILK
jgi:hypothetical protein